MGTRCRATTRAAELRTGTCGNVIVMSIYQLRHCIAEHAEGVMQEKFKEGEQANRMRNER